MTDTAPIDGDTPTPDEPDVPATNGAPDDPDPSPNSEAARWRTKLRETEAQRDTLADRMIGYQRRECELAIADLLDEPTDIWEIGQAEVSAFYGDDGALDEAQLRAAAGALCDMRPKLAKPAGPRWQNFGQGMKPPPPPSIGWESVISG